MKKFIYTIISILGFMVYNSVHANVDYVRSNLITYSCDQNTGIGTLRIIFGGGGGTVLHHSDIRYYHINHAGWVTINNNNPGLVTGDIALGTYRIPGCTKSNVCTTTVGLTAPTNFNPVAGNQLKYRYDTAILDACNQNYTYPDDFADNTYNVAISGRSLRYWPINSGPSNRDWSWGTVKSVRIKGSEKNSKGKWYCDTNQGNATARYATTVVTLIPGRNGGIPDVPLCNNAACDPTVANDTLRTTTLAPSEAKCSDGTVANFASSTDAGGKTTYTWTCMKPNMEPVSCNAYYKPLCVPTATNGCCDETRSQPQCRYSTVWNQPAISMTGLVMSTQDGPTIVSLTGTTACRPPVDGKPRILCDADPFTNITGTLSSFTLSGSVTQKTGLCRVIFDAPDVCSPREDVITIKPVTPECDPTVKNINDPKYCPRTVAETTVCLKLTDKFGNPVYDYATNRIESVLDKVEKNEYYKEYNTGTDNTRYEEGTFTIASNNYCAPICTEVSGVMCCPGSTNPICKPVVPPPTPCDPSNPSKTTCPNVPICVPTVDDPNKCDTVTPVTSCIPTATNNYCKPPIPTTVPGCDLPDYAGDPMLCIEKTKTCTAKLEVENAGIWTDNGDSIIYDEPARYRIVVDDNDPICRNGIISIQSVSATGGTLSGSVIWAADGTFTATISRDADATPKTSRGPTVQALFTQPGGITYGLTERADDFSIPPTPLTITGERMKGVRIIGNSAGTDITNFNLNNNGVIGEQTGPSVTTARNAIIKNAALLTRGVTANGDRSINDVYYAEGDINYSTIELRGFRTLIVKGSLTIDKDISSLGSTNPGIGIIVLRDALGNGGNITVADSVQYIHALVFAEGTFKGEGNSFSDLNPKTQLVLKGTLFSRNTIGGSADLTNLYISGGGTTTNRDLAFQQDLNNVRNGYGCEEGVVVCTLYRGYLDPFIIDFDNMQGDAPPGFSDLQ